MTYACTPRCGTAPLLPTEQPYKSETSFVLIPIPTLSRIVASFLRSLRVMTNKYIQEAERELSSRSRGKWVKARVRQHSCCDRCGCGGPVRSICVPPWQYNHQVTPKAESRKAQRRPAVTTKKSISTFRRRRPCHIARLPDELLVQIFRYLVPTGLAFHVFRFQRLPYASEPLGTVVHGFGDASIEPWPLVRSDEKVPPRVTALASVCRGFADIYHGLLYGGNRWIIECAESAVEPLLISTENSTSEPPSWSRLYPGKPQEPWPLTARSAKYVKDLIVLVNIQTHGPDERMPYLKKQLQSLLGLLGNDHALSHLAVDVRFTPMLPLSFKTPAFRSCPRSHLHWYQNAEGSHALKLQAPTASIEEYATAAPYWKGLERLRSVKDVILSGLITAELAMELAGKMQRREVPVTPVRTSNLLRLA